MGRSSSAVQVKTPMVKLPPETQPRAGGLRVPLPWLVLWRVIFGLLIGAGLFGANALIFSPGWTKSGQELPVALRSPLQASYQVDPTGALLQPVDLRIIQDAFTDRAMLEGGRPVDQMATVIYQLLTPVPSVTGAPMGAPDFDPSPTQKPADSATATLLPERTATQSPTLTSFSSATATPTASSTPLPTNPPTAVPTNAVNPTPVPPSKTPTQTRPDSTSTQPPKLTEAPTATPQQPDTPIPQPTNTPVPIVPIETKAPYPPPGPDDPYPAP